MQETINSQSMLKVGTILRGTYRIDSYLSSGGFGNTYVATNIEFEERVAIKEFFMKGITQRDENQTTVSVSNAENQSSFWEQKEKFKKEARRIRQLKNEHIVAVHDLFEENGTVYYVMDYVDGENLAERLKRTGKPMTEQEVREILPQILDALKSVHDAGIWHLDMKPANIMLTKEGRVKLIDFGASKQLNVQKGGATTSTAISYTNGYAPREQMEQNYDKFGPWTDIYALGATLYALLTNKRPPLPTDIDDDVSEDKHNTIPLHESTSDEMKSLILKMMQTSRNQRPQDVKSILSKMTMDTQATKEGNIDECTIIDAPLERQNTISSVMLKSKKKRTCLKFYIGISLAILLLLCIGLVVWSRYYGGLSIKPNYRVISEKDKTCELVGLGNYSSCISDSIYGDYSIPSNVDGYKVVRLGAWSFHKTRLSNVIIPPSVKSIGDYAFDFCRKLTSITIPEGVKVIPRAAFSSCGSLSNIKLPSTIKQIKEYAFESCENLSSIVIPEGVEEIPEGAFCNCRSLSEIHLPFSLKRIKGEAFKDNKSLSSIVIPGGVQEISMDAFFYTSISSLHFPKTIQTITDPDNIGFIVDDTYFNPNATPNFCQLKTIVSDIKDPFAVTYKDNSQHAPGSFRFLPKDAVLYIPMGTKGLYEKAGWTKYFSKVIEQ